ncbi:hypothetical protein Thivi_3020 [Thiocystis violascens DSM 198]|uniref:Uncharacterized protein n=1 Tax=Thiocystis violascens (strain ATCC 17096 / DSM 198 / 6111) TaxID=765911 RepID=I3YD33_THIV6|nr:hypothetical protein Thivi_3020 [Thiocystis violascens DSM 198]
MRLHKEEQRFAARLTDVRFTQKLVAVCFRPSVSSRDDAVA